MRYLKIYSPQDLYKEGKDNKNGDKMWSTSLIERERGKKTPAKKICQLFSKRSDGGCGFVANKVHPRTISRHLNKHIQAKIHEQ